MVPDDPQIGEIDLLHLILAGWGKWGSMPRPVSVGSSLGNKNPIDWSMTKAYLNRANFYRAQMPAKQFPREMIMQWVRNQHLVSKELLLSNVSLF